MLSDERKPEFRCDSTNPPPINTPPKDNLSRETKMERIWHKLSAEWNLSATRGVEGIYLPGNNIPATSAREII